MYRLGYVYNDVKQGLYPSQSQRMPKASQVVAKPKESPHEAQVKPKAQEKCCKGKMVI